MKSIFCMAKDPPADPVFGVKMAYEADTHPKKVDLGVGAYRDDNGKAIILPVVSAVEREIMNDEKIDKEYLPLGGIAALVEPSQNLIFINSKSLGTPGKNSCLHADNRSKCRAVEKDKSSRILDASAAKKFLSRTATIQAHSGTGSLMIIADFMKTEMPHVKNVVVSDPTWPIHPRIFNNKGFCVSYYSYWDKANKCVHINKLLQCLLECPEYSVIVLHACGHNPTGYDMDNDWVEVKKIMVQRNLIPLFDIAYQGFASGCCDCDAHAIRYFAGLTPYYQFNKKTNALMQNAECNSAMELIVCQSYAKNLGMYGDRIGMLHVVCNSTSQADTVRNGLKYYTRQNIGSCSLHGGLVVSRILNDEQKCDAWFEQLQDIVKRIATVRKELHRLLASKFKTPGNFDHIITQIGMFSYLGITENQCSRLCSDFHIYLMKSSRISLAGLNSHNVEYVAKSIDEVIRKY